MKYQSNEIQIDIYYENTNINIVKNENVIIIGKGEVYKLSETFSNKTKSVKQTRFADDILNHPRIQSDDSNKSNEFKSASEDDKVDNIAVN